MQLGNAANTLFVGCVIVLGGSFRKPRTSQLGIFRCTCGKTVPVLRIASDHLHLMQTKLQRTLQISVDQNILRRRFFLQNSYQKLLKIFLQKTSTCLPKKKLNPGEAAGAGSPVPPQPFSPWKGGMSSRAALELLHAHTGAVAAGQSLELWICCPLDMLGSCPAL